MLPWRTIAFLSVTTLLLAAPGCRKNTAAPPQVKPVTDAEAKAYGDKLANALQPCDADKVSALLDTETMVRIAAAGSNAPLAAQKGFVRGAAQQKNTFGNRLCEDKTASFKLLRVTKDGEASKALFRTVGEDGFNYVEFFIGKSRKGDIVAYDVYGYLAGERHSDAMSRLFDAAMDDKALMRNPKQAAQTLADVRALSADGRHTEARAKFRELPTSMQQNISMMLIDLQVAANMDEAVYLEAITAFEKRFPGSPALEMVSLDGFYLRKQYDKVIEVIARLRKRVGGDPYLDMLHAGALIEQKRYAAARPLLEAALKADAHVEDGYWRLFELNVAEARFADAVATLRHLRSAFEADINYDNLTTEASYRAFAQSPEGKAFLAARPAPPPAER